MPTLVLENIQPEPYDHLQQLAAASQRPVAVEAVAQLETLLLKASPRPNGPAAARPPDAPLLEQLVPMPAPCDLPLPKGVPVQAREGGMWLPDPPFLTE